MRPSSRFARHLVLASAALFAAACGSDADQAAPVDPALQPFAAGPNGPVAPAPAAPAAPAAPVAEAPAPEPTAAAAPQDLFPGLESIPADTPTEGAVVDFDLLATEEPEVEEPAEPVARKPVDAGKSSVLPLGETNVETTFIDMYDPIDVGTRRMYVAQVTVTNVGSAPIRVETNSIFTLATSSDTVVRPNMTQEITNCATFDRELSLIPEQRFEGCLVFDVGPDDIATVFSAYGLQNGKILRADFDATLPARTNDAQQNAADGEQTTSAQDTADQNENEPAPAASGQPAPAQSATQAPQQTSNPQTSSSPSPSSDETFEPEDLSGI